jgi:hypothetical protein
VLCVKFREIQCAALVENDEVASFFPPTVSILSLCVCVLELYIAVVVLRRRCHCPL